MCWRLPVYAVLHKAVVNTIGNTTWAKITSTLSTIESLMHSAVQLIN
jgi:hypothetical protein